MRRSNLQPTTYLHTIRYDGESIRRSAFHSGLFSSPQPVRGWNAIELYRSARSANLHGPSRLVYRRESRQCKAKCTQPCSLPQTQPDSHLIGICLSQPGERAVLTGVSAHGSQHGWEICKCSMSLIIQRARPSEKMPGRVDSTQFYSLLHGVHANT